LIFFAVLLRIYLFRFSNFDLKISFIPWFDYLVIHGGWQGIKDLVNGAPNSPIYSYSPPYLYLLAIAIPLNRIFTAVDVLKIVSTLFDFISAFYIYKIIEIKFPFGLLKWVGFFAVCFAPTVFINGAYWGQCDGIFTAFLVTSLFFVFTRKPALSLIFFSTAIAFKVQALVFAPLFIVLLFRKKIRWQLFFWVPTTYLLWMFPAYLTGYPLLGSITNYFVQSNVFVSLTMNAPNLYVFLSDQPYAIFSPLGWTLAACICGYLVWVAIRSKNDLDISSMLLFVVLISTIMPFILPKMHERYFYPAALISVALPFFLPKFRLIPIALQCSSLLSYTRFLIGGDILPLIIPALMNGAIVCFLVYAFIRNFSSKFKSIDQGNCNKVCTSRIADL
jgi:Gpi18-like mannosyltransferase